MPVRPLLSFRRGRRAVTSRLAGVATVLALLLACIILPLPPAQAALDLAVAEKTLDAARQQLDGIERGLDNDASDERLVVARDAAMALQRRVEELANELTPELTNLQARVTELGEPASSGEAQDVADQRASLGKQLSQLDAQVKLARLLTVESSQTIERILTLRRSGFQARLFEQVPSLLMPSFWQELAGNAPRDVGRVAGLLGQIAASARATSAAVWLMLLVGSAAVVAAYIWARGALLRFSATRVPAGRLRRSAFATAKTLLPTLAAFVIVTLVSMGLAWSRPPSDEASSLIGMIVGATTFGTFIANLGYALLSPRRPSWRLPPLPDLLAARLRRFPLWLGTAVGLGYVVERLATLVNVTLVTAVALNALIALVLGFVLVQGLRRSRQAIASLGQGPGGSGSGGSGSGGAGSTGTGQGGASQGNTGQGGASPGSASQGNTNQGNTNQGNTNQGSGGPAYVQPWWAGFLGGATRVLIFLSLICVLGGFVALGSFIVKQIAWITVIACAVYLFGALIDDAAMALLGSGPGRIGATSPGAGGEGRSDGKGGGKADGPDDPSRRLGIQTAVLASAIGRIVLTLFALVLILAPYGEGPAELMSRAGTVGEGVTLGEIQVRPGLVLQALLVLGVGLLIVHIGRRWLAERFLPTTRIDPAMRSSVTSLLGYLGMVVAVSMALSAVGLGLERVAWVASALSVGIGFGLQAVVSNFVAGLILLAERPVKVGDWVSVSGVEGDIRRINVRATEVQTGDRSTVIVPNSEFITKIVRNVTLADPLGVVSIKLPMPLDTDVNRVRDILMASLVDNPDVLATPAPGVNLEGIDATSLVFSLSGSVSSPRRVYAVRSALLFDILKRLREARVPLIRAASAADPAGAGAPGTDTAG